MMTDSILEMFESDAKSLHKSYIDGNAVMSFAEYLNELEQKPRLHIRDAARYLLDAVDYFGSETVHRPWGEETRLRIFNQAFADPTEQLVGQEHVQRAVRDAIESQVRDGRVNRLILIHGPNGSAKSTTIKNLFNGLEHYSTLEEGALFRFRWIFPSRKTSHGVVGFGARLDRDNIESFAHLDDSEIDAVLECEVRDHPLLLLPLIERQKLIRHVLDRAGLGDHPIPNYFLGDTLCHRCRQVADALIRTHRGDLRKVLAHVQVERWTVSRRYRRGTVQVGPQMSADAAQRQVTADRNLSALPTELQNMTLFETYGPLVDGSGGIVEFEDMLKRSLESFKYLLGTIETGEVLLAQSTLSLNTVLMGTTNDAMLEAFREHPEYTSFLERLTLIPVPFITQYSTEKRIYELQLIPNIGRHVAPHAVSVASHFAVLARLLKPNPEYYSDELKPIIAELTVREKAELYDKGEVPEHLIESLRSTFLEDLSDMRSEHSTSWSYEGRFGPSPRIIRQVLLKAAQSTKFKCLSPFAVLNELDDLCNKGREHPFLDREPEKGGYHDFHGFVDSAQDRMFDKMEEEIRNASGFVEESRYLELLGKYISHVRYAVKGEKVLSDSTGQDEDPDENMMKSVEEKIGVGGDAGEFRKNFISRIAAWAIEHPKQKIAPEVIFPDYLRKIRSAYFQEHRKRVIKVAKNALSLLSGEADGLEKADLETAEHMIEQMTGRFGYCTQCMTDALARLISSRFKSE
jgi:predicted Ser/Thr protein kinase